MKNNLALKFILFLNIIFCAPLIIEMPIFIIFSAIGFLFSKFNPLFLLIAPASLIPLVSTVLSFKYIYNKKNSVISWYIIGLNFLGISLIDIFVIKHYHFMGTNWDYEGTAIITLIVLICLIHSEIKGKIKIQIKNI